MHYGSSYGYGVLRLFEIGYSKEEVSDPSILHKQSVRSNPELLEHSSNTMHMQMQPTPHSLDPMDKRLQCLRTNEISV
jgi:hypothetical protein